MTIVKTAHRALLAVAGIVAMLALTVPSATAITNGVPDGNAHPNVGALLWRVSGSDTQYVLGCSGALITSDDFLTAGHCVPGAVPGDLTVTFDTDLRFTGNATEWGPIVAPENVIAVSRIAVHPSLWIPPAGAQSRNDVAVLRLAETVAGIAPVVLPPAGFLSEKAARSGLVGDRLVNVGYGLQQFGWANPTIWPLFDGLRRVSTSPYLGLTKDHVLYQMNATATGEGGVCVLDSGGPQFLEGYEVSLTTGIGVAPCAPGAIGASQRLDVPGVLEFLEPWTE